MLQNSKYKAKNSYLAVSVLGKSLKLNIKYRNKTNLELNKTENEIILYLPKKYKDMDNEIIVNMAIDKMYDEIAETEVENAMEIARLVLGFAPEDYKIERMSNSFCKCDKNKIMIINPEIVKYSRKVIDTTIIQNFCKLRYRVNSNKYKQMLEAGIQKYENNKYKFTRIDMKAKNAG